MCTWRQTRKSGAPTACGSTACSQSSSSERRGTWRWRHSRWSTWIAKIAYSLSRIYGLQQTYSDSTRGIMQAIYLRPLIENVEGLTAYYGNLVLWEPQLLRLYRRDPSANRPRRGRDAGAQALQLTGRARRRGDDQSHVPLSPAISSGSANIGSVARGWRFRRSASRASTGSGCGTTIGGPATGSVS